MEQLNSIIKLTEETEHLPSSSFYLGLTEIFANDILKEIGNKNNRESRIKTIEKLQEDLKYAINTFNKDKENYEYDQKQYFLRKKIYIDQKIKDLWDIHIKMLKKEYVIIS